MPIGLDTFSRPSPVTSRPSESTISFEMIPVTSNARPTASIGPKAHSFEPEPEAVHVVDRRADTGPRTTSSPSRTTLRTRGAPSGAGDDVRDVRRGHRLVVDGRRCRSPALADLRGRRAPAHTSDAVRVALPLPVMKRTAKSTIASSDVRPRPGGDRDEPLPVVRPSSTRRDRGASQELGETLLRRLPSTPARASSRVQLLLEIVEAPSEASRSSPRARLTRSTGPARRDPPGDRARSALGVVRDRAVHSGDRSRTLRAGSRRCRTRCRSASSSRSPAGSRRRTSAGAVRPRARRRSARPRGRGSGTRDRGSRWRCSCGRQASPRPSRRASASASTSSGRSRAGTPVDAAESALHELRDLEEADPPVEEGGDRDLVRRVERARVRAAPLACLARERQQREALRIGRLELERERGAEVERGHRVARRSGYVSANEIGTRMSG